MNETVLTEGDQLLTIFYRNSPIEKNELPFEDLKFEHFNKNHSWNKLFQEADAKKRGVDVFSLNQSPKNIGEANNQFMWYAKGSNAAGSPSFIDDTAGGCLVPSISPFSSKSNIIDIL